MSEIRSTLKLKKSTVAGEVPQPTDLEVAELGLNVADRRLYSKGADNTVFQLFGQELSDTPYKPAPFLRSDTPTIPSGEALASTEARTIDLPPVYEQGDLLVAIVATRNDLVPVCSDPDYEMMGGRPYLQNMANDFDDGPQRLSVFTKRAGASEPASLTFTRPGWVDGSSNNLMSCFMLAVANTAGVNTISEQYEDGTTCVTAASHFLENAFHLVAWTYVFTQEQTNTSSFRTIGAPCRYVPGYKSRLSYATLSTPDTALSITHYIDDSSSTFASNHSGIVISFVAPESIDVGAPVLSVQGKIGNVRLNLSEMDDVSLTAEQGSSWNTQVTTTPSADGEFKAELNTPTFYKVDSSGRDVTSDLSLLGVGRSFWLSEDKVSWTVYTPTAEPVADTVAGTIQLTLDVNVIPGGGRIHISLEDPANYELADGDSLIWNDTTQLWEAKRPEDAVKRIDDLVDVDTTTVAPSGGDVLEWNGVAWVPGDGSGIVSVTSVNGQSGDVDLGIKDMTDYFSEGNALEFYYNDFLASDLVPSGDGQWGRINANELIFNDRSFSGVTTVNAGPIIDQLIPGSSIWLSENGAAWTEFLLTQSPTTLGGVVKLLKIDGAGWSSTQEDVYISFQPPTTIQPLVPEDQAPITYDAARAKYVPGQPAVKKLVEFQDIDRSDGFPEGSALIYDAGRNLWVPGEVDYSTKFTFVKLSDDAPVQIVGPGIKEAMDPTFTNAYNNGQRPDNYRQYNFPISVERGKTYIFDLGGINFPDLADGGDAVRPWILTDQGGNTGLTQNYVQIGPIPPTDVETDWDPVSRLFRVTIPQSHAWDRYFIGLGSNAGWWDSYGVWTLLPASNAGFANTCLGWFALDLTSIVQDGYDISTATRDSNNYYVLNRDIIPYNSANNYMPYEWPQRVVRDTPFGNSGQILAAPYKVRAIGNEADPNDPRIGRVQMLIDLPAPYDSLEWDNSFIVETLSDGRFNQDGTELFTEDFFIHNTSQARGYNFTVDFHNVTGTKILPDMIKVTMFQNPHNDFRVVAKA